MYNTQNPGAAEPESDEVPRRGRPKRSSFLDKLDNIPELGTSSSCLQDHVAVYQAILNLPLLTYVNEPLSHLVSISDCVPQ